MYSRHNERKSVFAERFVKSLESKIYKHMATENLYINELDYIVDKYINTYHRTIKIKPNDVKSSTYFEYCVEHNDKDPKFTVGDHVRISKYKYIFAKCYTPNWSEDVFFFKEIKNTAP